MRVKALFTGFATLLLLLVASTAAATGLPPNIKAVIPDYNPDGVDRLFVVGERLPTGPNLRVFLGDHEIPVRRSEQVGVFNCSVMVTVVALIEF